METGFKCIDKNPHAVIVNGELVGVMSAGVKNTEYPGTTIPTKFNDALIITAHVDGLKPEDDWVFVFGSNLAGIHGGGAAKFAHQTRGLKYNTGATGYSKASATYGIPTKNHSIETLDLDEIKPYIAQFVMFTHHYPRLRFFITAVGCGLADLKNEDVAPLFKDINRANCSIPEQWMRYLE